MTCCTRDETSSIHAFKDVPLENLPAETTLVLVDSLCGFCCPLSDKVRSRYSFRRTREHRGTDIALSTGDSIRSAFDGVVRVRKPAGTLAATESFGNKASQRPGNLLRSLSGSWSIRERS